MIISKSMLAWIKWPSWFLRTVPLIPIRQCSYWRRQTPLVRVQWDEYDTKDQSYLSHAPLPDSPTTDGSRLGEALYPLQQGCFVGYGLESRKLSFPQTEYHKHETKRFTCRKINITLVPWLSLIGIQISGRLWHQKKYNHCSQHKTTTRKGELGNHLMQAPFWVCRGFY